MELIPIEDSNSISGGASDEGPKPKVIYSNIVVFT